MHCTKNVYETKKGSGLGETRVWRKDEDMTSECNVPGRKTRQRRRKVKTKQKKYIRELKVIR